DAGLCTASGVALGTPTTADNCAVASAVNNATEPYPVGDTTVTWTVTDSSGNTAQCTQTVTVTDNEPPVIVSCAPDQTLSANESNEATVPDLTGALIATDACDPNPTVSQTPLAGTIIGPGATVVTLTVTDAQGNSAGCAATLTVNAYVPLHYNAYVVQSPVVTYGTVAGDIAGTTAAGDGQTQSFTEGVSGLKGRARMVVQYALTTDADPDFVVRIDLHLAATWTGLDPADTLKVSIWNLDHWEDITADILPDGLAVLNVSPTGYVDADGNLLVLFSDTAELQREKLDTLAVDWLYALVTIQPPDTVPPSAPTGLAAAPGEFQVNLDWDDHAEPDVLGYNIYRASTAGGEYAQLNGALLTTSDYVDAGLQSGATYYYVVTAVDSSNNESAPSGIVEAVTVPGPPAPPADLTASAGNNQVRLDWAVTTEPDLAGYNVYRSESAGGPYALLNEGALVMDNWFVDSTALNGTTYYYVVTAVDTGGLESPASAEAVATPNSLIPMHVQSILMSAVQVGKNWKASASVLIVDGTGAPVPGALVTGNWTLDGTLCEAGVTGTTDAAGTAVISSVPYKISSGEFRFEVAEAALAGHVYDAAANVETSGTVTVP
ncbi:MAG: HYR domain-containing protein, partial [Verrucomicrobia bacterium]|nr:HYR domain-containing protein [Verrucomicrobiota bacterium]